MGRRPKVSHGIAVLEGEEQAKELTAMEQLIQAQIDHIRASSGQQNGPSAAQKKAKDEEEEAKGKPALMDELATKAALKEEHDDNSDTDEMPLLEDIYDTFNDDNSSLGEEDEARLNKAIKEQNEKAPQIRLSNFVEPPSDAWYASVEE